MVLHRGLGSEEHWIGGGYSCKSWGQCCQGKQYLLTDFNSILRMYTVICLSLEVVLLPFSVASFELNIYPPPLPGYSTLLGRNVRATSD
jgi:hypothetical protein